MKITATVTISGNEKFIIICFWCYKNVSRLLSPYQATS